MIKDTFDLCLNCLRSVPENSKRCLHCEPDLSEKDGMSVDEMEAVIEKLEADFPGSINAMKMIARHFESPEAFENFVYIGECPECASFKVGPFEKAGNAYEATKAQCSTCGHVWCTGCLLPLPDPRIDCGHWALCKACTEEKECEFIENPHECPKFESWVETEERRQAGADRL